MQNVGLNTLSANPTKWSNTLKQLSRGGGVSAFFVILRDGKLGGE